MAGSTVPFSLLILSQMLLLPALVVAGIVLRVSKPDLFRPRSRPGLVAQFTALTTRQRMTSVVVILGFFGFLFWMGAERKAAQADILRRQFRLPAVVELISVRITKSSSAARPHVEAIARFSEDQLRDYVRMLDAADSWPPTLLAYNGTPIVSYTDAALRWRRAPPPHFAGERRIRLGHASGQALHTVKHGRVLCFALQGWIDDRVPDTFLEAPTRYIAKGCSEYDRRERVGTVVLGLLDEETGTLHLTIN